MTSVNLHSLDQGLAEGFPLSYEQIVRRHEQLLAEITARAMRSPIYADHIRPISSLSELGTLPLTTYEYMLERTEREGLDKVLLSPVEQSFHTSGSTGQPKRFHYGREDIDRIAAEYAMFARLIGVQPGHKAWNLGGRLPDVSGYFLDEVGRHLGMDGSVTTLLKDDKDLIAALRRISVEKDIDILASPALILYLIGRTSHEPDFLRGLVEDKVVRSYHLPRPLARLVARLYLRGVDIPHLRDIAENATIAISYAEPLNPYVGELGRCFPRLRTFDVYGSTENPIMAAQIDRSVDGLSVIISTIIPEIASPDEVVKGKADPNYVVPAVPWPNWTEGLIGELIVTRPGQCLPLVRYPTGDIVQVVHPAHVVAAERDGEVIMFKLPLIRILGRAVETLDFNAHDESGNFMGMKVYSRYVTEALHRSSNVRWWEMYNIKGTPGRLAMVVVPESDPPDVRKFRSEVVRRLTAQDSDIPHPFQTANDLGRLEVIVLPSIAYNAIQVEIDRRIKEGRSYGQLKPKHIYVMSGDDEFRRVMDDKFSLYRTAEPEERTIH